MTVLETVITVIIMLSSTRTLETIDLIQDYLGLTTAHKVLEILIVYGSAVPLTLFILSDIILSKFATQMEK